MKNLVLTFSLISATLFSTAAFAKPFQVVCRSVYNFENSITLTVDEGVIVKGETFMEFTRTYGEVITVKVLHNGRTRFSYQSDEMVELFDADNTVLTNGQGALSYAGSNTVDFDCVK